jgi:predicted MFS family arabinose efflux permease
VILRALRSFGDRRRLTSIGLLGASLGMAAGGQTIVGAVAPEIKLALGVDNTAIGLLVTGASVVGALTTLPFGLLADRIARVRLLAGCVLAWGAAILMAGFASNYVWLLIAQLALGAGIGAAVPIVASLSGDLFPTSERGRIFGLILAGEFAGAAILLLFAGQMAAWWSWRGSFWLLAIPDAILAFALLKWLPEPTRGGMEHDTGPIVDIAAGAQRTASVHRLVAERGIQPRPEQVLTEDPTRKSLGWAIRYVLTIRSNVLLIIASALVYYYVAGLQAFLVVFLRGRFDVSQAVATMLLVAIGLAVVVGTLVTGPLSDALLRRGILVSRPVVAGCACLFAVVFSTAGLLMNPVLLALPLILIGGAGIGGSNPPMDAARLDIVHFRLWGRAESVRNFLQTALKSSAPLVFGWMSVLLSPPGVEANQVQGGGAIGLTRALIVMLIVLALAGVILLVWTRRAYPRDVATAMASEAAAGSVEEDLALAADTADDGDEEAASRRNSR